MSAEEALAVDLVDRGLHHGARTCDRDFSCFRTLLNTLKTTRLKRYLELKDENVVGVYLGWRGRIEGVD